MKQIYEFGDFHADPAEQRLLHQGQTVPLAPKVFETLLILLNSNGRLIDKNDFIGQLWPGVFVEDVALAQNISQLRKVLGDGKNGIQMIQTVPKRGYRFAIPVRKVTIEEKHDKVRPLEGRNDETVSSDVSPAATGGSVVHASAAHEGREVAKVARTRKSLIARIAFGALAILVVVYFFVRAAEKHEGISHAASNPVKEQQVTWNPAEVPVRNAVISPDGKYVAYADPTGLYVRQISTGEIRPWVVPKGFVAWPTCWFPDSTHLLITHIEGPDASSDLWKPSLWKVSLLGGSPQKLIGDAAGGAVSPDGSQIAYLPGPDLGHEIWVMDADGANSRRLALSDQPSPSGIFPIVWSPNGQRIAYVQRHVIAGPDPVESVHSLLTRDANGGDPQVLLENDPRLEQALWWVADGRILFAYRKDPRSKRGDDGVYSIAADLQTGKATGQLGQVQPITDAEGSIGRLSATSDGKHLVLSKSNFRSQVFIGEFDAVSRHLEKPRRLTLDANANIADAWTSDSRAILFVSNRNGDWRLFKQAIDETTAEVQVEGRNIFLPRINADGSQILYLSSPKPEDFSFPASLMSKPLAGGTPHTVLRENRIINFQCARSPATLCLFSKLVGQDLVFLSFDLEHGGGREVTRMPIGYSNWTLSPDGLKLAVFTDRHTVRFLSLATGAVRDVPVKDWPVFNGDWSADGRNLYMPSVTQKGAPIILEVNEAGKAEVVFQGDLNTGFDCLIQSPDGHYGLLVVDLPQENNAWMIDNF
jgi:DNA-binding winged helix-turn-helix (wHTH) protein/Tol biopolymer transport system component